MIAVFYSRTAPGRDVNLPETVSHRSGGNSLLFIPGQSLELTEEEWTWVKANRPDVTAHARVLGK